MQTMQRIKNMDVQFQKLLKVINEKFEKRTKILEKHFPNESIVRIDRDSTRKKGSIEKLLDEIQKGKHKISFIQKEKFYLPFDAAQLFKPTA